jgi:1-acyl-sn-glycerol-3-phosphate acyltransferase
MESWKYHTAKDMGLPPSQRHASIHRESGLFEVLCNSMWIGLTRGYLRMWHRLCVTGREHLPTKPPFVVVANHSSHLDALVLNSLFSPRTHGQVFALAAGDVFFTSPVRRLFSANFLNALPVWRRQVSAKALQDLRERLLGEPCGYVLFPEGTRSRDGQMQSFKAGVGMLVAGTAVPVVPCYLHGCYEAMPPEKRLPRPRRIQITLGRPLAFEGESNDSTGWKAVAARLETAVRDLAPSL